MARMILIRAIRNDTVNDLVVRNDVPAGKAGWLSRSLGLEQFLPYWTRPMSGSHRRAYEQPKPQGRWLMQDVAGYGV
jgi:hypothetical protein